MERYHADTNQEMDAVAILFPNKDDSEQKNYAGEREGFI